MFTDTHNDLRFWRDLTPLPAPLKTPNPSSPHILIVGGGVIGLTTAWVLLDKGYRVTILSKEWATYGKEQRLTSQIAGALWEYPPAVCGQHTDAISLQHSKRWSMIAYHIWDAIASSSKSAADTTGVCMKSANFFFPDKVENHPKEMSKMLEIIFSGVRGFRRDANIIKERGVDKTFGAVDAYEHLSPTIDTDRAMEWLTQLVGQKGARMITTTVKGDLFEQEDSLRAEYGADVIVNATGLAGTELAGDNSCYPIRGGLIRVINDGKDFPKVEHALTISADAKTPEEIVFIVPRNDNILIIGGIVEPNQGELSLTLESPIIKRMRERCDAFLPGLKNARLDAEYPLAQGLRPFRKRNIRVERELRVQHEVVSGQVETRHSRLIHSYGHGGAGWSLSFGCAGDVARLVEEAMLDLPPQTLASQRPTIARPSVSIEPVNDASQCAVVPAIVSPILAVQA